MLAGIPQKTFSVLGDYVLRKHHKLAKGKADGF